MNIGLRGAKGPALALLLTGPSPAGGPQ